MQTINTDVKDLTIETDEENPILQKISTRFDKRGMLPEVVDDLITNGASKFESIEPFESSGLKIKDFVILVDREQGGARMLEEKGYNLHSVIGINELLDILKEENKLDEDNYQKAKTFIAKTQV